MNKGSEKKSISGLAALILLALFAAGISAVLLSGAGVYKRLAGETDQAYDARTCVQYLANKLRQAPAADCLEICDFGDGDSLALSQWLDGEEYLTRIYCHEGWLMELFALADSGLGPEDGEKILPLRQLSVRDSGGLLRIGIVDNGGRQSEFLFSVRGGEAENHEE